MTRKLLHIAGVLFLVTLGTMLMVDLTPGDPAYALLGENATPDQVATIHERLGLNRPFFTRYFDWLTDIFTGDFGRSFRTNQPVFEAIKERLPVTVELAVLAQVMALLLAIPVGVLVAYRADKLFDRTWSFASSVLISVPHFVGGLLLSYVLAVKFHVFPVTGWNRLTDGIGSNLRSAFLPALTLALGEIAIYSRLLRADMIATLQNDFILAAQAKGMPARHVLFRHALRPSSFSLMTLAGLSLGRLIGGAVIVEALFALPGLGQLTVQAVLSSDLLMVQGVVMFIAILYVLLNTVVDLSYLVLDPRVRHQGGAS